MPPPEDAARAREDMRPAPHDAAPDHGSAPPPPVLPPEVTVERLALPDGRALQLYSWRATAGTPGAG